MEVTMVLAVGAVLAVEVLAFVVVNVVLAARHRATRSRGER